VLLGGVVACGAGLSDDPVAASEDATDDAAQVTGTLMYRERVALRPGSVAEVWLLDTSLADAPIRRLPMHRQSRSPIRRSRIRETRQFRSCSTMIRRKSGRECSTASAPRSGKRTNSCLRAEVMLIMVDRTQTKSDASSGDSTR
jgi:hypothetical protein